MMTVSVTLSIALLLGAAALMSRDRRSPVGWILFFLSAAPLLVSLSTAKAIFIWLAVIGIAGFAVTMYRGLRAGRESSA